VASDEAAIERMWFGEENVVDHDQINKEAKEDDMIYVHTTTRIIKGATARRADTKI
jgi:hypothetical protein